LTSYGLHGVISHNIELFNVITHSVSPFRLYGGKITSVYLKRDSDNMNTAGENTFLYSHVLRFRCLFDGVRNVMHQRETMLFNPVSVVREFGEFATG
jgi:hypothetical protein